MTYRSRGVLEAFCAAARGFGDTIETIVVDNASGDGTARVARERLPGATVLDAGSNLGFAAGCNLGARVARGTVLVFLNPDTRPTPGAVEALVAGLGPSDGAVGCKLLFADGRLQSGGGIIRPDAFCEHRGYGEVDRGQWSESAEVDYVPGAALAVRRRDFLALGGFHPGYFPGFYEDVELCLRLRARGARVRWLPTPVIEHEEGHAMSARARYWVYRNRQLFLARNRHLVPNAPTWRQEFHRIRHGTGSLRGDLAGMLAAVTTLIGRRG